jgi:DDE superfamily endonuclease
VSGIILDRDLNLTSPTDGCRPWLNDNEFLRKFRMSVEAFKYILDRVKDHVVFSNQSFKSQAPPAHQLAVLLHYLGQSSSGGNNAQLRNIFSTGYGTNECYKKRACIAIRSLRDTVIKWPDAEERNVIARRILDAYDWVNCIGIMDGTLFPLSRAPESKDAPDYHGRKFAYSISTLIVNDDRRKIRYYLSGFPGSVHDNRVFNTSLLAQNPTNYFGKNYFLVADSAYKCSSIVVSSFKKPQGTELSPEHEHFNGYLAKLRITSEHTIGILKARFPFLRSIPMKITDERKSLKSVLRMIDCCIILHNLLIDFNKDEDDIPDDWIEDDSSDVDRDDQDDIANDIGEYWYSQPINEADQGKERRTRALQYMSDLSHH